MLSKIRKPCDKKGFTLVELIVVLVILAILAALLIPALTGYIDKANKEKVIAETRMLVMAVQTDSTTYYGEHGSKGSIDANTVLANKSGAADSDVKKLYDDIVSLSELKSLTGNSPAGTFVATVSTAGAVKTVKYSNGQYTCEYTASDASYKVTPGATALAGTVTVVAD